MWNCVQRPRQRQRQRQEPAASASQTGHTRRFTVESDASRHADSVGSSLQHMQHIADNSSRTQSLMPGQQVEVLQRVKNAQVITKTAKEYRIRASGPTSDFFTGGENAGHPGVEMVDAYSAKYLAKDGQGNITEDSNQMDNTIPEYHAGHMLPKSMAGAGNAPNVFEQVGGQNSGSWRSFEIAAQDTLADYHVNGVGNKTFSYEMALRGVHQDLEYKF